MTTTATPTTTATHWTLDASHSSVTFSVRHLMITNVRGELSKVTGEASYDPAHPESASVTASIEVASINTHEEKRDGHLKSADFFDAEKFPTIDFRSTGVKRAGDGFEVNGDLTIRGVTKPVTLNVEEVTGEQGDPWGNRRIGATARTKIRRSDFGMTWNAALETGGVLVADDVNISLEVQFIKAK